MKFAHIQNGKVHWLFELDEKPEFHESVKIVDVTNVSDIEEGYFYNKETNTFKAPEPSILEPVEPQPTLEQIAEENLLETKYQTLLLEMML